MPNRLPSITIEGTDELRHILQQMSGNALQEVKTALRKVGRRTISKARSYLKPGGGYDTGQLKKSLGIRHLKIYKRDGRVVMYLGPRRGFAIPRNQQRGINAGKTRSGRRAVHDPFYIGHLVEFGHRIVPGGGRVQPYPFLRRAVDSSKQDFTADLTKHLKEALNKVVRHKIHGTYYRKYGR